MLLKIKFVAETLGLSVNTVRSMVKSGVIPGHLIGHSYRIDSDDLNRVLAATKTTNTNFGKDACE